MGDTFWQLQFCDLSRTPKYIDRINGPMRPYLQSIHDVYMGTSIVLKP